MAASTNNISNRLWFFLLSVMPRHTVWHGHHYGGSVLVKGFCPARRSLLSSHPMSHLPTLTQYRLCRVFYVPGRFWSTIAPELRDAALQAYHSQAYHSRFGDWNYEDGDDESGWTG